MNKLALYYDTISQPSRTIYTFLKVTGIPFEACKINILAGDNLTPEFIKINPRKKVPALIDGDFKLAESVAMVRYITDKYRNQVADHWYPRDLKQRARVDEYLEYQHLGTRLHYSLLFIHELTAQQTGQTPDPEKTTKLETNVKKISHIVQKTFLGDKKFLCGDDISVADIFALHEILEIVGTGHDPLTESPKLAPWMERVSQRLNPHFAEIIQDIYAMAGKEVPQQLKSIV